MLDLDYNDTRVLHEFKDHLTTLQISKYDEFAVVQENLTHFYKIDLKTNHVTKVISTTELIFR